MTEKHIHYQEHCYECAKLLTRCGCRAVWRIVRMNAKCPGCSGVISRAAFLPQGGPIPNITELNDAVYEECENDEKED